jgi:hypothetical protein
MPSPLLDLDDVRQSVKPEYADMHDEELGALVDSAVSELPDDAAENLLQTLGSVGRVVGPTLQRAAPRIAQGAASGATAGGVWGALIGGSAGLASSALAARRKPRGTAPGGPGTPAPPGTQATRALPTGQGAAATVLALFRHPIVRQALLSQALGSAGKEQVQAASGAALPRGAINDLLVQLLANASDGLPEAESLGDESYLLTESGEYVVDPAVPEQQAALVLAHLESTASAEVESVDAFEWTDSESDWDSVEDLGEADEAVQFF